MRAIFYTLLTLAVVLGVWMAIPAQMMFYPTSLVIDGNTVRVYRTFPTKDILGMPYIQYSEIIRPIDGSTPCADRQEFRYRDNGLAYAEWDIDHWAARCLATGVDYVYAVAWSPRLFDVIPLRPVEIEVLVHYENGDTELIYRR